MRRYVPLLIAGCALIAAACRDAISPTRSAKPNNTAAVIAKYHGGPHSFASEVVEGEDANATTVTFDILPEGGTAHIGDFTVVYDSNAVCNPETSGYGPEFWEQSCETLNQPITITARFWTAEGRDYAEFSPDIRFAPEKDVTLSVTRFNIIGQRLSPQMIMDYYIWYAPQVETTRFFIDESWENSELVTHFNTQSGVVWRKIHHFSGWSVRTGGECDLLDPPLEGCPLDLGGDY